jgi:hypothetical protein
MVIAYATQADQVADDGTARNSPCTAALLKQLEQPGLEIGDLFRRVAADVNRATGGRQLPELSVSLIGEFYFARAESDVQAWAKLWGSQDPAQLREFLSRYPSSPLALDVRERLHGIERPHQAPREPGEPDSERRRIKEAEREELKRAAKEQAEPDQRVREEAGSAAKQAGKEEAPSAAGKAQTAVLTPAVEAPPAISAPPKLPHAALVREIKKELKRVGCYGGRIDDKWPTSESAAAVEKLRQFAKVTTSHDLEASSELLDFIRGRSGRVCPLECGMRQVEKDGRCITKTCPSGFVLDLEGSCNRETSKTLPAREKGDGARVVPRTDPEPVAGFNSCSDVYQGCVRGVTTRAARANRDAPPEALATCAAARSSCLRSGVWNTVKHPHGRLIQGLARR